MRLYSRIIALAIALIMLVGCAAPQAQNTNTAQPTTARVQPTATTQPAAAAAKPVFLEFEAAG